MLMGAPHDALRASKFNSIMAVISVSYIKLSYFSYGIFCFLIVFSNEPIDFCLLSRWLNIIFL